MDLNKYQIGKEAYLYKPPTMAETIARGRKAKHVDHYIGPGTITRHIRTRSVCNVVSLNGREFQRDARMITLERPRIRNEDPMLAGYSLSIISNKKNNQEILIINGKDMPKGRNVQLKYYKRKSIEKLKKY